jgi:HAD superfamily hydrolase (TIGR01509 family)
MKWRGVCLPDKSRLSMQHPFLIIDCDGTLVDTSEDILSSLNSAFHAFGIQACTQEEMREYIGTGVFPLIQEKTDEKTRGDVLEHFKKTYSDNLVRTSALYPGWNHFFSKRSRDGTVILSNKPQDFLDAIVRSLGLATFCTAWFGREAWKEHKPSPLPVQKILEKFDISSREAVIVGDMPADIICGKNAGIKTIAALYGYGKREELLGLSPDAVIEKPDDLIIALQDLNWK